MKGGSTEATRESATHGATTATGGGAGGPRLLTLQGTNHTISGWIIDILEGKHDSSRERAKQADLG